MRGSRRSAKGKRNLGIGCRTMRGLGLGLLPAAVPLAAAEAAVVVVAAVVTEAVGPGVI